MNKSKWLALSLAAVMAVGLTACGGNDKNDNASPSASSPAAESPSASASAPSSEAAESPDDELKPEEGASLLVWQSKEERASLDAVVKQFTDKYGIPVKVEEVSAADQINKLLTDGPAGVGADVVVLPHDNLGKAVAANLLLPNDVFEEQTKAENLDQAINALSIDGVLYGYPKSVETYVMFYNKDLIATPPASLEEIVDFAKTFNDAKANKFAYLWEVNNFYFAYPFLATTGGYVYGGNGTDPKDIGLNNDGAVEGAKYFQSLHQSLVPMNADDVTYDIKKGLFLGGTLAMNIDGPWAIPDIKASGINFGVAPVPSIGGKPSVTFSGIKGWAVSANSKYPIASRLLARMLSEKQSQVTDFELTGAIPANKEAAADPKIAQDPVASVIAKQFSTSYPMPSIPEMGNVWDPAKAALTDIWNGKDPKASLDNAVKQIQEANAAAGSGS